MDSVQDTNIVACNCPSEVDVIVEAVDASAFVVAYDLTNVAVSDPKVLDFVDLTLRMANQKKNKLQKKN